MCLHARTHTSTRLQCYSQECGLALYAVERKEHLNGYMGDFSDVRDDVVSQNFPHMILDFATLRFSADLPRSTCMKKIDVTNLGFIWDILRERLRIGESGESECSKNTHDCHATSPSVATLQLLSLLLFLPFSDL